MFGLSQIGIEAIGAAVIALMIFAGGFKTAHDIDAHKYDELKLQYVQAQAKAVKEAAQKQQALDSEASEAANQEAIDQTKRANQLAQELANVQNHVSVKTIASNCVPYGFYRLLYAGSHGVLTNSLGLPAGQSDDACAPVGWSQLATEVLHNYGNALANAEQLNKLEDLLRKEKK